MKLLLPVQTTWSLYALYATVPYFPVASCHSNSHPQNAGQGHGARPREQSLLRPIEQEPGQDDGPLSGLISELRTFGAGSIEPTDFLTDLNPFNSTQSFSSTAALEEGILDSMLFALDVMQDTHFAVWRGTWPSAIDWTAAVMGTQISGALRSVSRSPSYTPQDSPFGSVSSNTIAGYFSHVASFYFGENAFSLRSQAYDDMLWVVLGWIEAVRLIKGHSERHFAGDDPSGNSGWFAKHFIPGFAHRARVFWDLASRGWDTGLCGGGMVWNPRLTPYKNAITNELFIAGSTSMYLYFPGDDNGFPFSAGRNDTAENTNEEEKLPKVEAHDRKYLESAIEAYDWLMNSGMRNEQGLFVDGFHIKGWRPGGDNGTGECDLRDENVFTYNQGVILTGQRGLWEATGNVSYLRDGHRLIWNVTRATGYRGRGDYSSDWSGLGRLGIMEEMCDEDGTCSQDGQTFKGIFFHHLAEFCEPLPVGDSGPVFHRASELLAFQHRWVCKTFHAPWVARNAKAALGTRNEHGEFGTWWTPGVSDDVLVTATGKGSKGAEVESKNADYRNYGIPMDLLWRLPSDPALFGKPEAGSAEAEKKSLKSPASSGNPNDRGRGRTVETQSGGVALLKALHRLTELYDK